MQKVYFRADASASIGYGHFIRTLALADMLKDDFDCTFFTCHPTSYQVSEMEKVCPFIILQEEVHFDEFLSYLQGNEIVVLDNYFFTTEYQYIIKACGCKLICIDDMHDKHYVADVVINHGITNKRLFSVESYTQLCLGYNWALLRLPFLQPSRLQQVNAYTETVVVCFGGADKNNLTERFVSFLQKESRIKRIIAIVGDRHPCEVLGVQPRVTYLRNLSATEVSDVFRQSTVAFLSTSTVCLEALSQQLPVAAGYYVDNQKEVYTEYVDNNLIYPLGNLLKLDIDNLDYHFILDKVKSLYTINCSFIALRYKRMFQHLFIPVNLHRNGLNFVDYRLLDEIHHLFIWKARNADVIRSQMVYKEPITWQSHLNFVKSLSIQYKKIYMAVYRGGLLVGSVNIEYNSVVQVERGLFILPKFWGSGDATLIDNTLCEYLREQQVVSVTAKVFKSNTRSLYFHQKLGYKQVLNDNECNYLIKYLNE